jgi:S1-C subfamily serine protease
MTDSATSRLRLRRAVLAACLAACVAAPAVHAADLVHTIAAVKPSVVGIGTLQRTRSPAINFVATGFVVGDGLDVVTNAHAIPEFLDTEKFETLGVVLPKGEGVEFRPATLVSSDREHDIAHLRLSGAALPALKFGDSAKAAEGQQLAFTGYPLGMVLGLHPVTHRATLAALTPVVMPSLNARKLDAKTVAQLQRPPFGVFQLDATAYPGNSGSPVYDPDTGEVLAIINMVYVKGLKETAITAPSGITYAIPAAFILQLLQQKAP